MMPPHLINARDLCLAERTNNQPLLSYVITNSQTYANLSRIEQCNSSLHYFVSSRCLFVGISESFHERFSFVGNITWTNTNVLNQDNVQRLK